MERKEAGQRLKEVEEGAGRWSEVHVLHEGVAEGEGDGEGEREEEEEEEVGEDVALLREKAV